MLTTVRLYNGAKASARELEATLLRILNFDLFPDWWVIFGKIQSRDAGRDGEPPLPSTTPRQRKQLIGYRELCGPSFGGLCVCFPVPSRLQNARLCLPLLARRRGRRPGLEIKLEITPPLWANVSILSTGRAMGFIRVSGFHAFST